MHVRHSIPITRKDINSFVLNLIDGIDQDVKLTGMKSVRVQMINSYSYKYQYDYTSRRQRNNRIVMRIKPKVIYRQYGETPVYQCECGHCFTRMDLLSNKKIRGEYNYCPECKVKLIFTEENM